MHCPKEPGGNSIPIAEFRWIWSHVAGTPRSGPISPKTSIGHSAPVLPRLHHGVLTIGGAPMQDSNIMRDQALRIYRSLTSRRRAAFLDDLIESGNVPVAILFYHRIADHTPNGWTMRCADFARQLDWLQQEFDVVSLAEAQARIQSNENRQPTVAITFDDGYADNARFAIPELARRGLTATYFVSTDFITSRQPFPHDLRTGHPLQPNTIDELQQFAELGIEIGGHTQSHCDLGKLHDVAGIQAEILGGIDLLREWTRQPVQYFAFPFGLPDNTTQMAVDILAENGIQGFCTAYGAWNWPDSRGFHLRRIHADPGLERLKNWLTLDPRKLEDKHVLPFTEPSLDH